MTREVSIRQFLGKLSSTAPSPGGGAASALASALGCALGLKICRLVLKRRKTPARAKPALRKTQAEFSRLARRLEALVREDALAYEKLVRAMKTGQGLRAAKAGAVRCPLAICDSSVLALKCVTRLRPLAGKHLGSDLNAARALLKAGFSGADLMVEINLVSLK